MTADAPNDPRPPAERRPGDERLVETRVDTECVFDGRLLHARRDTVRLPDGGTATREYVAHPGAVLILPVRDDGRLVVERQFRYPLDRVFLEFPAGKLDHGEAPLDTARRELEEEAGFIAGTWTWLGVIHPVISYSTERIELWLAEALTHVGARLDHGEFLEIVALTEDELLAAFDRGEVTDAKTIAALFAWRRRRGLA
jgi:ADP-ribose pyrophosphatase